MRGNRGTGETVANSTLEKMKLCAQCVAQPEGANSTSSSRAREGDGAGAVDSSGDEYATVDIWDVERRAVALSGLGWEGVLARNEPPTVFTSNTTVYGTVETTASRESAGKRSKGECDAMRVVVRHTRYSVLQVCCGT